MHDRRTFLTLLAAIAAGCTAVPRARARDEGAPTPANSALPIGLQLYTVRAPLARDFAGTLEQVAAIGFRDVELAGYHGHPPARVRQTLDRFGLRALSVHAPFDDVRAGWPRLLDEAAALDHHWITVPWVPGRDWGEGDWRRLAALLNARGADAARAGRRIGYHNHDFELRGDRMSKDRLPLELLIAETDPVLVDFELDVYWLVRAGHDPVAWLDRHPARFRMLHIKDSAGAPAHRMVDVGAGVIDWAAVLDAGRRAGVQRLFLEHDEPEDALRTARAGFAHLADLGGRAAP